MLPQSPATLQPAPAPRTGKPDLARLSPQAAHAWTISRTALEINRYLSGPGVARAGQVVRMYFPTFGWSQDQSALLSRAGYAFQKTVWSWCKDITEQKAAEEEAWALALYRKLHPEWVKE